MIFRTDAQKKDLVASWDRFDRSFFASGACHVLAWEFLKRREATGFRPLAIEPDPGFRGGHVFASNGGLIFDYHGWSEHSKYIEHYLTKISRIFPGWRGKVMDISEEFWTDPWFSRTYTRKPFQYLLNPTDRANAFIARYLQRLPSILEATSVASTSFKVVAHHQRQELGK